MIVKSKGKMFSTLGSASGVKIHPIMERFDLVEQHSAIEKIVSHVAGKVIKPTLGVFLRF
jgi:hypothetical protein